MSELKPITVTDECGSYSVYSKSDVDAVIAEKDMALEYAKALTLKDIETIKEKDKEIAELKAKLDKTIAERDGNQVCIDALIQNLEDAKATEYAESVDAGMRERRLKRALWIARAERAKEIHFMWCQLIYDKKYGIVKFNVRKEWGENIKQGQMLHTPQWWADVWDDVERKCRAKAEKFGG